MSPDRDVDTDVDDVDADVIVVGGGPAGSAAAIALARAGQRVTIIDKATFPRDKCCGDGLTTGALRELQAIGFDPARVPSWKVTGDVWLRTPKGVSIAYPLPPGRGQYAAIAERQELDHQLVLMAKEAGATLLDGHAVTNVVARPSHIEVEAEGLGRLTARYLIAADGMWSPVRKHLGLTAAGYRGEWHAFRQYFSNVGPMAANDMFIWFEPEILPGYFWSFPLPGNRANVGFGIDRERVSVQDMKQLWPELLARPHIAEVLGPDAVAEGKHRAWPIPARIDDISLTAHRTFFVGDAAAATDVMSGEGIAQALLTGRWAAEAVLESAAAEGAGDPAAATAHYRDAVGNGLVADHRMSNLLKGMLASAAGVEFSVRFSGLNHWTRRNFARWLFEDYPRAQLFTPRRYHRRMFTQDGAYTDRPK